MAIAKNLIMILKVFITWVQFYPGNSNWKDTLPTNICEGVDELVGDNGVVVEFAEAEAIAAAIKELAGDRQRYEQMCTAARKRAEQFSWVSMAEKYLDCYQSVIKQKDKCDGR